MRKKVAVIGAGIAGMSAAKELSLNGFSLDIFESKSIPGGRTTSHPDAVTGETIDNGQHVCIGAYEHFFNLLEFLDSRDSFLTEDKLALNIIDKKHKYSISQGFLPGRFGLLQAVMNYNALDIFSKRSVVSLLIWMNYVEVFSEESTLRFLQRQKQTKKAITYLWEPLIVATMNHNVENSSAEIFLNMIRVMFKTSDTSKLILPKVPLATLYKNFQTIIEAQNNSKVHFLSQIISINFDDDRVVNVIDNKGNTFHFDYLVIAVPPKNLERMLVISGNRNLINTQFDYSTIISLYFWTDKPLAFNRYTGLIGSLADWIFDLRYLHGTSNENYPCSYALTISNANDLLFMSREAMILAIIDNLREFGLMQDAKVLHSKLIIDQRATISIDQFSNEKRPESKTPIQNLYIAGDWTATGYPATMEGAALSGINAAKKIIEKEISL